MSAPVGYVSEETLGHLRTGLLKSGSLFREKQPHADVPLGICGASEPDAALDRIAAKAAWMLDNGATNENADLCREIITYRAALMLRAAGVGAPEGQPRGTERDRIAFEAGWLEHETATETAGIGGSDMECIAAFKRWCGHAEPVAPADGPQGERE